MMIIAPDHGIKANCDRCNRDLPVDTHTDETGITHHDFQGNLYAVTFNDAVSYFTFCKVCSTQADYQVRQANGFIRRQQILEDTD